MRACGPAYLSWGNQGMRLNKLWGTRVIALVLLCGSTCSAHSQLGAERFSYYGPGIMAHPADIGSKDRRVFYPNIQFPIRVGPEAGADGGPLHAYANSQLFRPNGFEVNDLRLFAYPWV